jgi:mannose-6-phosphate isomerase-like protein (cupin superfamily)
VNVAQIYNASDWFKVLQTTERSQTAVMTLESGAVSEDKLNSHRKSDQVLLVVEGEVCAEVSGETTTMKAGDVMIVPAGAKHRFTNPSDARAVTFSVYAPPAYPED